MVASLIFRSKLSSVSSGRATTSLKLQNFRFLNIISPRGLVPLVAQCFAKTFHLRSGNWYFSPPRLKIPLSPVPLLARESHSLKKSTADGLVLYTAELLARLR